MEGDKDTEDAQREREAKDSGTRAHTGGPANYGPPEFGERSDPKKDPESGVPREPVKPEPGDIAPKDDPEMGKETRGG